MSKTLLSILVIILMNSCKSTQSQTIETEITTLQKGALYGAGQEKIESQNIAITTQKDWISLVNKMNTTNTVISSETTVDFKTQIVLAVFMSVKKSGGYAIEIVSIETQKEVIIVSVKKTSPAPNSMVTQAIMQPYHIVTIPVTSKPVTFKYL
ncbi:protease complex subunit PrcB family protein [Lacinutrix undariae]